jgi:ABC-2 type transport system permease protein
MPDRERTRLFACSSRRCRSTWLFAVPIRGSVLDVYLALGLLILANLTLGLPISTRAQSQFQAMQMMIFVFLPSILLSGFMFPFAGMPRVVQWIAEVLPLTHFLRLIRGVMLRGAALREMWPDVLALAALTRVVARCCRRSAPCARCFCVT